MSFYMTVLDFNRHLHKLKNDAIQDMLSKKTTHIKGTQQG